MAGVYVIEAPDVERVKVGWSFKPQLRLVNLQVSSPVALRLRFVAEIGLLGDRSLHAALYEQGDRAAQAERLAHEQLRDHRLHGEWFACGWDTAAEAAFASAVLAAGAERVHAYTADVDYTGRRMAELAEGDPFEGLT